MARRFPQDEPMSRDDLRQADKDILEVLSEGRATRGYLLERTEYVETTIYDRLEVLEAAGHVETIHEPTALVELVDDPRES